MITLALLRATYEFLCLDDEEAKLRAKRYLDSHDVIERWADYERIARLMRYCGAGESIG